MQRVISFGFRRQPGARRSPVPMLVGMLSIQLCLYAGIYAGPLFAQSEWKVPTWGGASGVTRWRRAQARPEHDPALGMPLPIMHLTGAEGRPVQLVRSGRRTAVLFLSGAGCSDRSLIAAWSGMYREVPGFRLVVVVPEPLEAPSLGCKRPQGPVEIAVDRTGEVAELFNARWQPRAYGIDPAGRICYVQPDTLPDSQAMITCAGALRASGD